jgi:hypothetical protein
VLAVTSFADRIAPGGRPRDGLEAYLERVPVEGAGTGPDLRRGGDPMAEKYEGYCVKCKAKREFEGEVVTLKNGRRAAKGKCPVCGTTVMRILGK